MPSRPAPALASLLLLATAARAEGLGELLDQALAGSQVPAAGALVIQGGKVAEQAVRGVRRKDQSAKVKPGDPWLIGSTGKVMTVALIARLVARGTLAWDAPLEKMLPKLAATMRPDYRPVTLLQLLSHRSGLPENLLDAHQVDRFFSDQRPLPEQRLDYGALALQDPPAHPPGTAFGYCNTGFILAAAIAEQATGKSYEELMQREVFKPLGMTRVGFGSTQGGQPRGHQAGKPMLTMTKADDGAPAFFAPAGFLHMSLADWARFNLDQLAGSRGKGKLLTPADYKLMQTAQEGSPAGVDWGVQASIAGRRGPVLVHGGSDGNWLAWVILFPEQGSGALVVVNASPQMGADQVTRAVLGGLFPRLSPAAEPKAEPPKPEAAIGAPAQ